MFTFRSVFRVLLAIVVWYAVLFPTFALFGTFVLPPDPFTQLVLLVPGIGVAIVVAIIFVARSGSLRHLRRFASIVFAITVVVGVPVNILFEVVGDYGSPLAVLTALFLLGVVYAGGYYLVYENGYQRLKSRYIGSDTRG